MTADTEWSTWAPPGVPFPWATAIYNNEWCLLTEGGHDPATGEIPDGVSDQTRLALAKAAERLAQAGMTLADVLHVRLYVTAREHAPIMDAVLAEAFEAPRPASGALVVCDLFDPRMKVEIEFVARRGARRR